MRAAALAVCLVLGCSSTSETPARVDVRDATAPPPASDAFGTLAVDASGRWVASPSASRGLHRLALLDMTTRSFRAFDEARGVRSVAFWDPARGVGLDALAITTVGTERIASLVSLSLEDGRALARHEIGPIPAGEASRVLRVNDMLFVATTSVLTAYDGATGTARGAFTARPGTLLAVTPVPAARRLVVVTTRGAVVLREEDASVACVAAPMVEDPKNYDRKVETALVGTRAFVGVPLPGGASHHAVVDVATCSFEGIVQGGPTPLLAKDAIGSIFDRYAGSPDAPPLPESVTKSPVRFHLAITDARTRVQSFVPLDETPSTLVATPDRERFVTIDVGGVRIVDAVTREVRAVTVAKPVYLATSADSRFLYLGTPPRLTVVELSTGTATPLEVPFATGMQAIAPARLDGLVVEQEAGLTSILERIGGVRTDLPRPLVAP